MDLVERLIAVQSLLGLKGYEIAEELRITPEWYSKVKGRREDPSDVLELRLGELLRRRGLDADSFFEDATSGAVNEDAPKIGERTQRKLPLQEVKHVRDSTNRRLIAPGDSHAPSYPTTPTRAEIEQRLARYLDVAERVPGGLGHAWVQVKLHLKTEDLEQLMEE